MTFKKSLALLLALLMAGSMLAACGNATGGETTTAPEAGNSDAVVSETEASTVDKNGFLLDDLQKSYNFGTELNILYDTDTDNGDFAEEVNGNAENDAIYARNLSVEERLGVTLRFTGTPGGDGNQAAYMAKVQNDVNSGDSTYDIYAAYSRTVPLLAYNGLCRNLAESDYINLEKPWWPEALTFECMVNNKLFFVSGDIATSMLWYMCCMFVNRDMWNDLHIAEDIYDLVLNNQWTLDKMIECAKLAYADDGDGTVNNSDTFGLVCYNTCFDAFLNYSGIITIAKDGDGMLKLSDDFTGEKAATIVSKLGSYCKDASFLHSGTASVARNAYLEGRSLFIIDGTFIAGRSEKNAAFEYAIIPGPKYNTDQENYWTNMRYPFTFYAVSSTTSKVDAAECLIEAEGSENYRSVTPIIFELTMKSKYSSSEVSSKMYDIIRDGVVFDFGRIYGYSLNNYYPDFRNICFSGGTGWTTKVKSINKLLGSQLDAVYKSFED